MSTSSKRFYILFALTILITLGSLARSGLLDEPEARLMGSIPPLNGWVRGLLNVISSLTGSLPLLLMLTLLSIGLLLVGRKAGSLEAAYLALSLIVTDIITVAFKVAVARPRPMSHMNAFSYPSGHVARLSFLSFHAHTYDRRSSALMISLLALVALSRVALKVHYPTDVAGGMALGYLVHHLSSRLEERLKLKVFKT